MEYKKMSDSAGNASLDKYSVPLEQENRSLHRSQVRKINDSMRKVGRISRESKQFAAASHGGTELPSEGSPGLYVEVVGSVEYIGASSDDTGQFCLPEPDVVSTVSAALDRAFALVERERRDFRSKKDSPVVKRWKLL